MPSGLLARRRTTTGASACGNTRADTIGAKPTEATDDERAHERVDRVDRRRRRTGDACRSRPGHGQAEIDALRVREKGHTKKVTRSLPLGDGCRW